jgi:hypothetical protein
MRRLLYIAAEPELDISLIYWQHNPTKEACERVAKDSLVFNQELHGLRNGPAQLAFKHKLAIVKIDFDVA